MKILRLTAENVKRLRAVEIEPDGTVQVITGRNAQGKTSVLDAIWLALGGGSASRETQLPIRDGETQARVELDLGDLTVTRTWKGDKTNLKVRSKDGGLHSSPQSILDTLVGRLSFDPLEFTRLSDREQVAALVSLVDLGFDPDELAQERKDLFNRRTEFGRSSRELGDPQVDPDLPDVETSSTDLVKQFSALNEQIREQTAEQDALDQAERQLKTLKKQVKFLRAKVEKHRKLPDPEALTDRIHRLDEENKAIRANNHARALLERKQGYDAVYEELTGKIDELDEKRANALAAAEFPVDGLSFTEDGVLYKGVPFSQASAAEQIRVSLAMAMSLNPDLRVIRILDGSLLDAEAMKTIAKMAKKKDYQVWIERVEDSSKSAILIEDGQVREG